MDPLFPKEIGVELGCFAWMELAEEGAEKLLCGEGRHSARNLVSGWITDISCGDSQTRLAIGAPVWDQH